MYSVFSDEIELLHLNSLLQQCFANFFGDGKTPRSCIAIWKRSARCCSSGFHIWGSWKEINHRDTGIKERNFADKNQFRFIHLKTGFIHRLKGNLVVFVKGNQITCASTVERYWYIHQKEREECCILRPCFLQQRAGQKSQFYSIPLASSQQPSIWNLLEFGWTWSRARKVPGLSHESSQSVHPSSL